MKMKYAFVIGSNAFIVAHGVISYTDNGQSKEALRVKSIYHDNEPNSFFSVDLDIEDTHGTAIKLTNNALVSGQGFKVETKRNSVQVLGNDGNVVFHAHQLDEQSAMDLESNIAKELEVSAPVVVIRIFGDFKTGALNISAENEKLFINDNGYATSAMHGTDQLQFTAEGVVL